VVKLQDLLMDGALQAHDYSEMKMKCASEIRNIQKQLCRLEEKDVELAPKLEKSVHLLHDMSNTFKVATSQQKAVLIRAIFPESVVFDGTRCRTPRLNSVLELLLNIDRGFGENKKGRTLKNLEFSPLVEPGR
jgi:site-specific DNA recombinase